MYQLTYVPANITSRFQSLDLTVNGVAKLFLKEKIGNWYANDVTTQIYGGAEVFSIEGEASVNSGEADSCKRVNIIVWRYLK